MRNNKTEPGARQATRITRRTLLGTTLTLLSGCATTSPGRAQCTAQVDAIASRIGGRLGVSMRDTRSGKHWQYNGDDRFAMCSTFKLLLAGHVLARVERSAMTLDKTLSYDASQLLPHSPVTTRHAAAGGISVRDACVAIIEVSDNTGANLLLRNTGGPAGLTAYLHNLGDHTTRLDREETALNTNLPGDLRDTTTPAAMTRSMATLLTGPALQADSRAQLIAWMQQSRTGLRRLRAGLPASWSAGNKTGTGENGAVNDVLIAWHPAVYPSLWRYT